MAYKALTHILLPGTEVRKAPGETITKQEMKDAGQTDENIQQLLESGTISEDMSVDVHPDHAPVEIEAAPGSQNVVASDEGSGESA